METDEFNGPVFLQEKPKTELTNRVVFALPEGASEADYDRCAEWLRAQGVAVPFINPDGMLVVSLYRDEDGPTGDKYYEFVQAPAALFVSEDGEVRNCFYNLERDYTVIAGF